ncbi:MAG: ArsR family transcriptional regulator [Candidatus Woesearchaeota archaeon]
MFKELNILKLFFEEPRREFNVREIARILKISPATASKELKELVEKNILSYKKERIYHLYQANFNSEEYKDIKIYYNIRKLKISNLINEINKFYLHPTIILFGSCSKGEDIETSDIDLVIISEKTKEFPKLKEFEKILNKELQIFNIRKISEIPNKHLINNILNGINIQGGINGFN